VSRNFEQGPALAHKETVRSWKTLAKDLGASDLCRSILPAISWEFMRNIPKNLREDSL
jgi:hypothetical protein